jgi:hypothetical protein
MTMFGREVGLRDNTDVALGVGETILSLIPGSGAAKALERKAAQELDKRFIVELGEQVSKSGRLGKLADFLAVAKSGKSAVVQEVSIGSKPIKQIEAQLKNGLDYIVKSKGLPANKVKLIFRTTDPRLASQVRKELPTIGKNSVKVILDK